MEKNIVTKEEAIERIYDNMTTLKTAHGKVRFNKTFFAICAGIGTVCTGIGIAGIVTLGLAVAPITTTGLGLAAAVTSGAFYKGEVNEGRRISEKMQQNYDLMQKISEKDAMHQARREENVKIKSR